MPSLPYHSTAPSPNSTTVPASRTQRSGTPPPLTSTLTATTSSPPSPRSVASHVQQTTAADPAAPIVARPQQRDKQSNVSNNDPTHGDLYYTDKGSHIGGTVTARHSAISLWPPSGATPSHLPRTSSLLPPARVALDSTPSSQSRPSSSSNLYLDDATRPTFQDPFNAQPIRSLKDPEVDPTRRPSRSSSVGGLSESFRNLNRWSASSTSSGASPGYGHIRNTSGSSRRRASLGIFGFVHSSPKKLQKFRRSSVVEKEEKGAGSSTRPFQTLPHIATLPSLHLDLQLSSVGANRSSGDELQPAPVRLGYTDEHADRAQDEVSAEYWDGPAVAHDETPLWTAHIGGKVETRLPSYYSKGPTMPYQHYGETRETRGHARNRSTGAKGSADSTASSARERAQERDRVKQPSQKAMLSKALQKANTAVQLDNAQNPEAARQAYAEACALLQQVLQRTGGDEDRRKLEAIRETYTKRIEELDFLLPPYASYGEKALPRRPGSLDHGNRGGVVFSGSDDEDAVVETATVTRIVREETDMRWAPPATPATATTTQGPYNNTKAPPQLSIETSSHEHPSLQSSFSRSPMRADSHQVPSRLQPPMYDSQYLPPPLSPRRPLSPAAISPETGAQMQTQTDYTTANRLGPASAAAGGRGHRRDNSHESVSWLDPIEESGGSTASSVHSRSSSVGIRRKHIRAPSGETEAEFDAALDDAIEAAYNEGYEPDDGLDPLDASGMMGGYQYQQQQHHQEQQREEDPDDAMASVLRRVERAREAVRASEREAMIWASEREQRLRLEQEEEDELARQDARDSVHKEDFYDGTNSDEEEEQFLDDMRREYAMEDFTFTASTQRQQGSGIPRESDSSGFTSRTWHSSMNSNPTASTSTTMLTTLSESTVTSVYGKKPPPPPPSQALPQLPPQATSGPASHDDSANSLSQGVRSRRLSGNARQLKIDTLTRGSQGSQGIAPSTAGLTHTQSKTGGYIAQQRQALSAGANIPSFGIGRHADPSPVPSAGLQSTAPTPGTPAQPHHESENASGSPTMSHPGLPKNFSSSSLRNMQTRNMSVSNPDVGLDNMSPGTPLSTGFGAIASASASQTRFPAIPSLPTPVAGTFKPSDQTNNTSTGGLHLFDHDIHESAQSAAASASSGHVQAPVGDAPVLLEPCPTDAMLRPFWLMRCLYQTLCHPRGGYISNKLFVPRDVWRVKGVKLRNMEDKIANCDYLTAALQKLAKVDNCDADAVLEEMQSLEGVLEQVQAVLTRKLGNEVGVHGASHLFKDAGGASTTADGESSSSSSMVPRSTSVSAKGSSGFSWRRLRGKNSSAGLSSAYAGKGGSGGGGGMSNTAPPTLVEGVVSAKDAIVQSVPMTSHPTSRPAKRNMSSVHFVGPNANYMNALARLFDAAQTVDQLARQVEDPGLRHADKTQVGLELCTRHAAEFFGFYICRFVLADLTMLLDKFVKRGSEWVLA